MEIRLCADNYGSYKLYDWVRGVLHLNGVAYFLFSILYDKSNQGENDVLCKTKDLIAMISCTHQSLIKATNQLKSKGFIYQYEEKTEEGRLYRYRIHVDKIAGFSQEIEAFEKLNEAYDMSVTGEEE